MKKSGVFEKAKTKSGVIEGGIDALVKNVKKKDDAINWSESVRIAIYVTSEERNDYKSFLAKKGITIQEHLREYILKVIDKTNEKNK